MGEKGDVIHTVFRLLLAMVFKAVRESFLQNTESKRGHAFEDFLRERRKGSDSLLHLD